MKEQCVCQKKLFSCSYEIKDRYGFYNACNEDTKKPYGVGKRRWRWCDRHKSHGRKVHGK